MRLGFIFSLIFAIIVTIFAIQNSSIITVNFLFTKLEISLALIIFISVVIGAIIVTFLGLRREFTLKHNNKVLNNKVSELQKEIDQLRNISSEPQKEISIDKV